MGEQVLRVGIVGAASLLGKELAEELAKPNYVPTDLVLLDDERLTGQMTAIGDEAAFIRRIESASFLDMSVCFFAGSASETIKSWQLARQAGATVVDLTGALAEETGALVLGQWVASAFPLQQASNSQIIVPAHPVAVMIALVAARCSGLGLQGVAATILEPASERGQSGMDEMHEQTIGLLSFREIPKAEFDAQVAFNLLPELGENAKTKMRATFDRILSDYRMVGGGSLPALFMQPVHAPVFHGYGIALLLDFDGEVLRGDLEAVLSGEHVDVLKGGSEGSSTLDAAGREVVLLRVAPGAQRRHWVWMAADNLRTRVLQAIACVPSITGGIARSEIH